MSEAPPTTGSGATDDAVPAAATPHLLVMPPTDGVPSIAWPGPEDRPAWAIPVTVPGGTRGYAIFLPMVPEPAAPAQPAGDPPAPEAQASGGATGTTTPSAEPASATVPAAAKPTASTVTEKVKPPEPRAPESTAEAQSSPPAPASAAPATAGTSPTTAPATWPGPTPRPVPQQSPPTYPPLALPYQFRPVPRPPSFFERAWQGPAPVRNWTTPAAVLAGALGLAFFVPLGRTGIGWFLGWLVLTAGVVGAVRRTAAELPRAERWVRAGWAVATLALLAVLAFRNAWWLVTFCVLGALGCAALAIVGGRLVRSILFSLVAAPIAAFRGLPWIRKHSQAPVDPGMVRRVVGSVAATAIVLVVFGALLSSADAVFSRVLRALVPEIGAGTTFQWLFLLAVGGLIAVAAIYTITAPPDLSAVDKPTARSFGLVEWAPPITALTALFGGFVAVQFTALFGGQRHVLRTTGLSYAEYARSGFWQLVIVTVLTLAVLGGVTRWARRGRPVERALLRILLGLLSTLSIVIVVSALYRMYTYQKVYSFTGERIFVMACELLLGTVFLMILAAGLRWRGGWIPRLTVGLAVTMLLSLAVLNPEDYAAKRNIARYEQTGKIDAWYLRALSADATPALADLPDPVRRCTLSWIADDLAEPDPWYAWNLGRTRARAVLDRLGPGAIGNQRDCRAADEFDLPKNRRSPR